MYIVSVIYILHCLYILPAFFILDMPDNEEVRLHWDGYDATYEQVVGQIR